MTVSQGAAEEVCAREPIHIPGHIQPYGALLVLHPETLGILQASGNAAAFLGLAATQSVDLGNLVCLSGTPLTARLREWIPGPEPFCREIVAAAGGRLQMTTSRSPQGLMLEVEPFHDAGLSTEDLHHRLQYLLDGLESLTGITEIGELAAREIAEITGFGRVMVYRFGEDDSGTVLAEYAADGELRYMDLRFPASDIPAQARQLYVTNRIRLIADAEYEPVPVEPALSPIDGLALDMSLGSLRSVSPVHRQYMRNMGTRASMSVSLVIDGKLWGLIACHHDQARCPPPRIRAACEITGRVVAQHIGARLRMIEVADRLAHSQIATELLTHLARADDLGGALRESPEAWLRFAQASASAVIVQGRIETLGRAPSTDQIMAFAEWLQGRGGDPVFASDNLAADYPPAEAFRQIASGVVAVSISELHPSFIMWFRPEIASTVRWAGDPRKAVEPASVAGAERLTPRHSFKIWEELVQGHSKRWTKVEVEAAREFRNSIISLVLRQAEMRAEMTDALERSNAELESFSYSVSHDLRAPFRHIVGFAELLGERERALDGTSRRYLDTIIDSALSAGHLVDDLLAFSRLGRTPLAMSPIDMNKLVSEVVRSLEGDWRGRAIEFDIRPLPVTVGDSGLLRQTMFNLIGNAIKYTRGREPAHIRVEGEVRGRRTVYRVIDNGAGFDMSYAGKLFGVFQRLHRAEEFEGTGIGLALAKRIVERHGGEIAGFGEVDKGATFTIDLPRTGLQA